MALLLRLALLATWLERVMGHGYLNDPPARNVRPGQEFCPQCGNGPGVCGDSGFGVTNYLEHFDGVQRVYAVGSIVEFEIIITAHHKGHFEFSICERQINSSVVDPEGCFKHWKLQRVPPGDSYSDCVENDLRGDCQPLDPAHPERWYLPPLRSAPESHTMRYRLPEDLRCTTCTLQWRWWSANSCVPAPGYGCYFDLMSAKGWDSGSWCGSFCGECQNDGEFQSGCGEQFRNCADIQIVGDGPSPQPTLVPDPAPTPVPDLSPLPAPVGGLTCTATPGLGLDVGASDQRCDFACGYLSMDSWPCREGDMCLCTAATTPSSETTSAPAPALTTTPPATGEHTCLHNKNCTESAWCNQPSYEGYCRENGELNHCPHPWCLWTPEILSLLETTGEGHRKGVMSPCDGRLKKCDRVEFQAEQSLLQLRGHSRGASSSVQGWHCRAVSNMVGATDEVCGMTCSRLPEGVWPCGESGPCVCDSIPSPVPPTPAPTLAPPVPTPQPEPESESEPEPEPESEQDVVATIFALQRANSTGVFKYDTGTEWVESDLYTWEDMISAVTRMATEGVGRAKLWLGEGQSHVYGLVNIAAFLAQCMQETIRYNACDENNWSGPSTVAKAGGSIYSSTSACGQMGQSYQDYTCSAEEDAIASGHMACSVDNEMQLRAQTQAGWYGAPAKLFCAPRSKVPKAPRWDFSQPWCGNSESFPDDVDLDTYLDYVNSGEGCKDYTGIKAGGWSFTGEGCNNGACPGAPAPLFNKSEGRTDLEGCCWWGRGVIQTTGVCNFGKLNFYLGKRAHEEGRVALFPEIDFCTNPGAICEPDSPPELKWIAGFFYWLTSVQPYEKGGWSYLGELRRWVDDGMSLTDTTFIDGASGIVNRGCHNPPNCGTGDLHGRSERRNNFQSVLVALGLVSL